MALRSELGRRPADFFQAHPEFEVEFAGVTSKRGRAITKAIAQAEAEMQRTKVNAATKKRLRDTAEKKLRRAMSGIIRNPANVLDPPVQLPPLALMTPIPPRSARSPR